VQPENEVSVTTLNPTIPMPQKQYKDRDIDYNGILIGTYGLISDVNSNDLESLE